MAKGANVATTDLSHPYSAAEINEVQEIFRKMFEIQNVVLKINQQYIASAAQDDKYRTEPSFKLQGSYRNMNKMTEKVSAIMSEGELMQMIKDHYLGEAQLLTTGAEANLLKLAELRGNMTEEESERWDQIKKDFLRNKAMGGDDADTGGKVVAQLADLVNGIQDLSALAQRNSSNEELSEQADTKAWASSIEKLVEAVSNNQASVKVVNQPVPGIDKILTVLADTLENAILPLVKNMDKKMEIDLRTHDKMKEISDRLRELGPEVLGQGGVESEE